MPKAEDMFKQALPVAKTGKEKAEILIYLGQLKAALIKRQHVRCSARHSKKILTTNWLMKDWRPVLQ
jgi:hypothetical protein